ncbi:MAG TPA: N-6 DNA methylase [Acidimicrobiales bacterium]
MPSPARRRQLGSFYTPADVADRLVAIALDGLPGEPVVCDPACGDGVFLLAAARALARRGVAVATIAHELLWGCDVDAGAVAAARAAIGAWSGVDPGDHLLVGDGLCVGDRWRDRFDAVVGNPPFLNQLERATVRRSPLPPALQPFTKPYTDTAWLFLVVARGLVRDGGRVILVQPQSLVAARDASSVRDAVAPMLAGLWWCNDALFDASVRVCAPLLDFGVPSARVRRWSGRDAREIEPIDRIEAPHSAWSALVPSDVPITVEAVARPGLVTLASIATATAGFRDEYYGLQPFVIDEPGGHLPKLVTSGLIDAGGVSWGERPTRFGGQRYLHPRVDVDDSRFDGRVRRWVEQRLVPKVVVATQTRVVEVAVDARGRWVPSTPVIAVQADPVQLWRVAAALSAPAVSAWAMRRHAGAALSPDAIKLSAAQVLEVPLPWDDVAWQRGADALAAGRLVEAGEAMTRAYGSGDEVFEWWRSRLPAAVTASYCDRVRVGGQGIMEP